MKKVLIIDDDQFILKVYQKKFETEGLHVEVAADGPSALAALRASVPELVLLDLMLPGMNGVELLSLLRTLPGCADLPVLVFSHSYDERLIEAARAAGALQCLNKNSVSPNKLLEIVRAALAAPPHRAQVLVEAAAARPPVLPSIPAAAGSPEDLRNQLVRDAASVETRLRAQLQAFSAAATGANRTVALDPLRESFKRLAFDSDRANLPRLSLLATAVNHMLEDLREHPDEISAGTSRTLTRAVEAIPALFQQKPPVEPETPTLAVVMHEQRGVAPLLAEALRMAHQPAVAFRDQAAALAFIEENPSDILVTSLEAAQPTGGDFVRRAQMIPGRSQLPAVLLSNQPPGSYTVPAFLVSHAVLSFPFTAEEVVVSALVRLVTRF